MPVPTAPAQGLNIVRSGANDPRRSCLRRKYPQRKVRRGRRPVLAAATPRAQDDYGCEDVHSDSESSEDEPHVSSSPNDSDTLPTLFSRSASRRDCVWQRLAGEACKGYTLAPRWLEAQRVPRSAEKSGTSSTPGGKNDAPNSWSLIVHRSVREFLQSPQSAD